MVWELDAAATAECCHVAVYRRGSTADAVADATEYTRCKIFLNDWGGGDTGPPSVNMLTIRFQILPKS